MPIRLKIEASKIIISECKYLLNKISLKPWMKEKCQKLLTELDNILKIEESSIKFQALKNDSDIDQFVDMKFLSFRSKKGSGVNPGFHVVRKDAKYTIKKVTEKNGLGRTFAEAFSSMVFQAMVDNLSSEDLKTKRLNQNFRLLKKL